MITCILPMAGAGSRFTRAGYALPKYAIPAQGQPLLVHALRSLPLARVDRLVLVAQRSAVAQADPLSLLPPDLARRVSALELIDGLTGGQAETVLAAQAHIDERPLLIYNCDTAFHSPTLADLLTDPARSRDGVLGSFAGRGSHWSFARLDPQGRVLETAEKQRISPHCLTGLYHFQRGSDFLNVARPACAAARAARAAGAADTPEVYVAPLYNALIAQGRHFVLDPVAQFWPLGTPAELAETEARWHEETPPCVA